MALVELLLLVSAVTLSQSQSLLRSSRYLKSKYTPWALPIDVCWAKNAGSETTTSIQLECVTHCSEERGCEPRVISYHYMNGNCSGEARSIDTFTQDEMASYPFNCLEEPEEEIEGVEPEVIEKAIYYQDHLIISVERGIEIELPDEYFNGTNLTDTEDTCIRDEDSTFFRTIATTTSLCSLYWKGDTARWVKWTCNATAFRYEIYYDEYCETMISYTIRTDANPLEQIPGYLVVGEETDARQCVNILNGLWFPDIIECSTPDYVLSAAVRNGRTMCAVVVFIVSVVIVLLQSL